MLRIVPHTLPRVGRSYEHFPDGFELHLLLTSAAVLALLTSAAVLLRWEMDLATGTCTEESLR